MAASVICTYLFFLGGGFTTIQFLPTWLRRTTTLVPTRYAIDGLRPGHGAADPRVWDWAGRDRGDAGEDSAPSPVLRGPAAGVRRFQASTGRAPRPAIGIWPRRTKALVEIGRSAHAFWTAW